MARVIERFTLSALADRVQVCNDSHRDVAAEPGGVRLSPAMVMRNIFPYRISHALSLPVKHTNNPSERHGVIGARAILGMHDLFC